MSIGEEGVGGDRRKRDRTTREKVENVEEESRFETTVRLIVEFRTPPVPPG